MGGKGRGMSEDACGTTGWQPAGPDPGRDTGFGSRNLFINQLRHLKVRRFHIKVWICIVLSWKVRRAGTGSAFHHGSSREEQNQGRAPRLPGTPGFACHSPLSTSAPIQPATDP